MSQQHAKLGNTYIMRYNYNIYIYILYIPISTKTWVEREMLLDPNTGGSWMHRAMNSPNSLVKCLSSRERERDQSPGTQMVYDVITSGLLWVVTDHSKQHILGLKCKTKYWESVRAPLIPTWRFLPFRSMYFLTVWPGHLLCSDLDMYPAWTCTRRSSLRSFPHNLWRLGVLPLNLPM